MSKKMLKRLFEKKESNGSEEHELSEAVESLRCQIERLLTLLDIRTEQVNQTPQQTPVMQIQILESYLSLMETPIQLQYSQANKQRRHLEEKMRQIREALDQREEAYQRLEETNGQLERKLVELRAEMEQKDQALENAGQQRLTLESKWKAEKMHRSQAESDAQTQEAAFMELCVSLIRFRDQLWIQRDYAQRDQSDEIVSAVSSTLALCRSVLEDAGVEVLDGGGTFDMKRHYTAETVITDDPALDWQIQRTVKEGYVFQDKLIRQQEVAVFRYTQQKTDEDTMKWKEV